MRLSGSHTLTAETSTAGPEVPSVGGSTQQTRCQFYPRSFQEGRNFVRTKFTNTKVLLIFHFFVGVEHKFLEPDLTVPSIQILELL